MHKLWLKNFEFQISPNTWNTAQDLVQVGGVRHLQEVEKHFWVATVADGEVQFEVEVMLTPHKIKAFTCECWSAGRHLMCAHIAAALFKVRQFLEQKNEARATKTDVERKDKTGKLTVQNILENISPEDLADFVRNYARRDRDFALSLKTWFAGALVVHENPYLLVLDAALPRQVLTRPLLTPEMRRLRKTLADLETRTVTAGNEANAAIVFQITSAVLQKITPLLAKSDEARQELLVQYCRTALQHQTQLPPEHLSPELRETLRDFLFDFLIRYEPRASLQHLILPFLAQHATDEAFFTRISQLFDQMPYPAPPAVLHLFLAALAQRKLPEAVARVLQDYRERAVQAKDAIAMLYHLHYWEAALHAGEYFLENNLLNSGQRREMEDLLLASAEKAGDRPRHAAYLRQRYRHYGHESVLQRLKTLAGPDWPEEQQRLLAELRAAEDIAKVAPLLVAGGDFQGLIALLQEQHSLDLLHQYDHVLLPNHQDFVRDFYVAELSTYLADHFGKQASEQVRSQLVGLIKKNQTELAKVIVAALVDRFPDRQTLSAELAEMFPKSRRQAGLNVLNEK